jgi:hypothetical protein
MDDGDQHMTHGGYGGGSSDPFGGDPFGGTPSTGSGYPAGAPGHGPSSSGYAGGPGHPGGGLGASPPSPQGEVNTLATLSVVFAVVFAPVGAVLGHLALHQIKQRNERGRERAIIGLTLSYVVIVAAIIALMLWLLLGNDSDTTPIATSTPTTTTVAPLPPPPPVTTVLTASPTERPTVQVEDLRPGDCIERVQQKPDPNDAPGVQLGVQYRTPCQVRDGVLVVTKIVSSQDQCPGYALWNNEKTIYACTEDFKG